MTTQPKLSIGDVKRLLQEEGERKRLLALGPCGVPHGDWPGICGRAGKAQVRTDGLTRFIVFRCPTHLEDEGAERI